MFWTNTKRIFRTGFFNFWRNGTVSLASVLVMMVTLSVIGMIIFSGAILERSLSELRNKVDVTVTFVSTAAEDDVLKIQQSLESLSEVSLVTYVSKEESLEQFRERHANDQSILSALEELGYNPLGAMLNIRARDPSQYASVVEFLQPGNVLSASGVPIIDRVNYFQNKAAIDRLTEIISTADRIGFALTILFALISVVIAFNTIRLTIYIAKDEISVMRLVGASTSYIQGPFVVVGIIYGFVAGLLALLLFVPVTYWFGNATAGFFVGLNIFSYYVVNLPLIFIIIMVSGMTIGAVSSALAVRRYLRV
jgi:cell division transport system permease protein